MDYICDNCNEVAVLNSSNKLRRRVLPDLVYEYYFVCNECEHEHVSYYTNRQIRREIKRIEKKRKLWSQSETVVDSRRRLAQINLEDKILKKEMEILKDKMLQLKETAE